MLPNQGSKRARWSSHKAQPHMPHVLVLIIFSPAFPSLFFGWGLIVCSEPQVHLCWRFFLWLYSSIFFRNCLKWIMACHNVIYAICHDILPFHCFFFCLVFLVPTSNTWWCATSEVLEQINVMVWRVSSCLSRLGIHPSLELVPRLVLSFSRGYNLMRICCAGDTDEKGSRETRGGGKDWNNLEVFII